MAVVPSALEKINIKRYGGNCTACVLCEMQQLDRLDAGEIIPCIDSSRENAMWQPCRLCWEKINIKRYGGIFAALFSWM